MDQQNPSSASGPNDDAPPVDRTVEGVPYFALQDQILYVTRGWDEGVAALGLQEWLAYVDRDPELRREEIFDQLNINTNYPELWCEPGRTRWSRLPDGEWIHFAPAGVLYLFSRRYRGGPVADRWQRLVRDLGIAPSLAAWQCYVARDRFMDVPDPAAVAPWPAHVCAVWRGAKGQPKHVFRWFPPAVWLYRQTGVAGADEATGAPEPWRMEKAQAIATALGAEVYDGVDLFGPLYRQQ